MRRTETNRYNDEPMQRLRPILRGRPTSESACRLGAQGAAGCLVRMTWQNQCRAAGAGRPAGLCAVQLLPCACVLGAVQPSVLRLLFGLPTSSPACSARSFRRSKAVTPSTTLHGPTLARGRAASAPCLSRKRRGETPVLRRSRIRLRDADSIGVANGASTLRRRVRHRWRAAARVARDPERRLGAREAACRACASHPHDERRWVCRISQGALSLQAARAARRCNRATPCVRVPHADARARRTLLGPARDALGQGVMQRTTPRYNDDATLHECTECLIAAATTPPPTPATKSLSLASTRRVHRFLSAHVASQQM